tara:strand:+ start:9096 stop:9347 length:252 start_codon:yes stop_codon:yes gene_type:complete
VLEKAIKVLLDVRNGSREYSPHIVADSYEWILSRGPYAGELYSSYLFSAKMVCAYLDINYSLLHEIVENMCIDNERINNALNR